MKYEEKLLPREYRRITFGNCRVTGSLLTPIFSYESFDSCDSSLDVIVNISIEQTKSKQVLTLTSESGEQIVIRYYYKFKRMEVIELKPKSIPHKEVGEMLRAHLPDILKGKTENEKGKDSDSKLL